MGKVLGLLFEIYFKDKHKLGKNNFQGKTIFGFLETFLSTEILSMEGNFYKYLFEGSNFLKKELLKDVDSKKKK